MDFSLGLSRAAQLHGGCVRKQSRSRSVWFRRRSGGAHPAVATLVPYPSLVPVRSAAVPIKRLAAPPRAHRVAHRTHTTEDRCSLPGGVCRSEAAATAAVSIAHAQLCCGLALPPNRPHRSSSGSLSRAAAASTEPTYWLRPSPREPNESWDAPGSLQMPLMPARRSQLSPILHRAGRCHRSPCSVGVSSRS